VKGSRDHVAIYLEAADCASAPVGWKRYVDFRIGAVTHTVRWSGKQHVRGVSGPLTGAVLLPAPRLAG
jgi:hypothetical protein